MGYLFIAGYIVLVGVATFLMKASLKTLTPYQLNFLMGIGMLITGLPASWVSDRFDDGSRFNLVRFST